jgi:hypothetical protein
VEVASYEMLFTNGDNLMKSCHFVKQLFVASRRRVETVAYNMVSKLNLEFAKHYESKLLKRSEQPDRLFNIHNTRVEDTNLILQRTQQLTK